MSFLKHRLHVTRFIAGVIALILVSTGVLALGYRNPSVSPVTDGVASAGMTDTSGPHAIFFNPGAAGKRRFKVVPSIGVLSLEEGQIEGRIVPL